MPNPLLIRPAFQSPHLATVARWLHDLWWQAEGYTPALIEAFPAGATGPAAPCCPIAERDGEPVGTATLDVDDLPSRRDLTPWLGSVLVAPAHRRAGVATVMVEEVLRRARDLGHARLWLFTPDQAAFYAARGWETAGPERWRDQDVTPMYHDP